ncbi:MAG: GNAT family N-acetyltransferase [Rubrivivax sp.]
MTISIIATEAPDPADREAVDQGLSRYNEQTELVSTRPLCVFAKNLHGEVIGGAIGRTLGTCCELQQLWVAEDTRGSGLGTRILSAFEQLAAGRGCKLVYLDTFTFQAPAFYEKLGYRIALTTSGFAAGVSKFTMHKHLPDGSEA